MRLKVNESKCCWLHHFPLQALCSVGIVVSGHHFLCTCVGFTSFRPRTYPCIFSSDLMLGNSLISLSSCLTSFLSLHHFHLRPSFNFLFIHLFSVYIILLALKVQLSSFCLTFFFIFRVHLEICMVPFFSLFFMEVK